MAIVCLSAVFITGFLVGRAWPATVPDKAAVTVSAAPVSAEPSDNANNASNVPVQTAGVVDEDLQKLLDGEVSSLDGKWDVYAESLSDGRVAHAVENVEQGDTLVSASLIKLFIMGTVFDQIEKGAINLNSVSEDLNKMITVSDNEAANDLINLLGGGNSAAGMEAVNDWTDSIGCSGSHLNRLMLADNGLQNYTTAEDCARILRMIYNGQCVSAQKSAQMLKLLKAQTVNNRLPAQLPAGTVVAHKTGDLQKLSCGDVGIVYSPTVNYILCIICNNSTNDKKTAEKEADISVKVYEYYNRLSESGGRLSNSNSD